MLRRQAEKLMKDTCKIEAESIGVGSFGQPKPVWVLVANSVACRVIMLRQPRPAAEQVGNQEQIVEQYRLIVPYNTALAVNQQVTMSSGEVYQIVDLVTARTDETDAQAVMVRARGT